VSARGSLRVIRAVPRGRPDFDTALSRAILLAVDDGQSPETLRLYEPDDVVAFSVADRQRPGFAKALRLARQAGFGAVLRLAGGRAALFQREGLAFAWSQPTDAARAEIPARFAAVAEWVRAGLASLGVDARVGQVRGEYCPGAYSVNVGGARKLMGVGQRVVRNAAHVGGVISVGGRERGLDLLAAIYDALEFEFDPATVGAVAEEVPGIAADAVAAALVAQLDAVRVLQYQSRWSEAEDKRAAALAVRHRLGRPPEEGV
jgi:lipoate-protein ligase A